MGLLTDKEFEEMRENLRELNHSIDLAHLRCFVNEITEGIRGSVNLRESPLYKKSPADICDMLEELGWYFDEYESNGWEQDTWIPFYKENGTGGITLSYSGFYWTMTLRKTEEE